MQGDTENPCFQACARPWCAPATHTSWMPHPLKGEDSIKRTRGWNKMASCQGRVQLNPPQAPSCRSGPRGHKWMPQPRLG